MKISIAMATYNGAKYLREQLASFAAQHRLPDELVVTDDGSTDDTLTILKEFAASVSFAVRVQVNEQQVGPTQNFGRAIDMCRGDLIFLSDQDDVWFPEKLSVMEKVFSYHPEILVAVADAEIVGEDLDGTGLTLLGQIRRSGLGEREFGHGCSSAFRAALKPMLLPVPFTHYHDEWLHDISEWLQVRMVLHEVLQLYRRHEECVTSSIYASSRPISWLDHYRRYAANDPFVAYTKKRDCLKVVGDRILSRGAEVAAESGIELDLDAAVAKVRARQAALAKRMEILGKSRLARVVNSPLFYLDGGYDHFRGWISMIRDMVR